MRYIFLLLLALGFNSLYAQYPNSVNKMRLGTQTTGDGLIYRHSGVPNWTPTGLVNSWQSIDTTTGNLWAYRSGEWRLEVAGDLQQVYPKVINKSGVNIKRGEVVGVDTSQIIQGDLIRIIRAIGDGGLSSKLIMGIAATDINDNAEGYVVWFGYVREVIEANIAQTGDTLNVGDILYLSATQPGRLTKTEPTPPALKSTIALVVRKPSVNNMTLLVRPNLNEDLRDLNDVNLNGINNGQTIVWDSLNMKWIAGNVGTPIDTSLIATKSYVDSKVDSTRLTQDSILVYYIGGAEVGRDTLSLPPAGVTSITAGVGLTGGTITSTGTIAADTTTVLATKDYVTTRGYLTTEVDGSVTNEGVLSTTSVSTNWGNINTNTSGGNSIAVTVEANTGQKVTFTTNTNGGGIVLGNDTTVLSTRLYADSKVDSTRLTQDSILVYYTGGIEVGRDTISGVGGGGTAGVTSITAGVGLTGGTITSTGTIAADTASVLVTKSFLTNQGYGTGTVTGSGTTNNLAVFNGTSSLTSSIFSESSQVGLVPNLQVRTSSNLGTYIGGASNTRYTSFSGVNTNAIYLSAASSSSDVFISYQGGSALSNWRQYWKGDGSVASRGQFEIGSVDGADLNNWESGVQLSVKGTSSMRLPQGTTAQRPGTPSVGMIRNNIDNNNLDFYTGTAWENPLKSATATGLGTAGRVFYADANGRAASALVGSGLTLSNDTLRVTSPNGATNLTFSGASSPVTLNSDTGTDVTFTAGTGVTFSQSSNNLTISASAPTRQIASFTSSGGQVVLSQFDNEIADNDLTGTHTGYATSDFVADSSYVRYTGTDTIYVRLTAQISFLSNAVSNLIIGIGVDPGFNTITETAVYFRTATSGQHSLPVLSHIYQCLPNTKFYLNVENTTNNTITLDTFYNIQVEKIN